MFLDIFFLCSITAGSVGVPSVGDAQDRHPLTLPWVLRFLCACVKTAMPLLPQMSELTPPLPLSVCLTLSLSLTLTLYAITKEIYDARAHTHTHTHTHTHHNNVAELL